MSIKKTLLVVGMVTGIGLASVAGLGAASATTNVVVASDNNIIDRLATRFSLDREEVAQVFEQQRAENQKLQQQRLEDRLSQAVESGAIDESQKAAILAKLTELEDAKQANWDALEDMTPEERKAAMDQQRKELKKWADDHNIPKKFLRFIIGPHRHGPPLDDRFEVKEWRQE